MMDIIPVSPHEISMQLAKQLQAKRLSLNLSQKTLALRAGVSLSVLKKFEHSGKISLESLLKLALVLDSLDEFKDLFQLQSLKNITTLDELLQDRGRKRGRQ